MAESETAGEGDQAFPPKVRIGVAVVYAVVVIFAAVAFLDGFVRNLALVMAVAGGVVANEVLKRITVEEAQNL